MVDFGHATDFDFLGNLNETVASLQIWRCQQIFINLFIVEHGPSLQ